MNDLPDAIPAATLVIFREAAGGPPELLMVERARAMAFAGGALVFPGGRVDPADHVLADRAINGDGDERAARIAAIRETIEEVGLAVGLSPLPSQAAVERMRAMLHGGTSLGEALDAAGTALDLAALTPFAHWRPAHAHARVFDTRFYLARLPAGCAPASVDATENVRLVWSTAANILEEADAGRVALIFPTRRNLERLALFGSIDEAVADALEHRVDVITPFVEERDGVAHLCIPAGLGYPVTSEPLARAMRG